MNSIADYLKIYVIITAALSLIYLAVQWLLLDTTFYIESTIFCLIPFIISLIIFWIGICTHQKYPKITKIAANIINLSALIVHGFFMFLAFMVIQAFNTKEEIFTNPKQYEQALKTIRFQKRIQHFPAQIPLEAYNIEFNKTENNWFGSEAITLKFNINEEYINNEINKYNYISIEQLDELEHTVKIQQNNEKSAGHQFDSMMTDSRRIKIENFTFYIINDKFSENSEGFFYHYGIGVNNKTNQIIYYYTCPD